MKKTTFLLPLIVFSCSAGKKLNADDPGPRYVAEFNDFVEQVVKEYAYLDDKKEIWECMTDTYSKRVGSIRTTAEHILFYETLLNELYDTHIHLHTHTSQSYRLIAPIYVTNNEGKTYIRNVWQTQLNDSLAADIVGAEVVSFNGIDFQTKIQDFPTSCHNKQDEQIREWIANKIVAGKRNEQRILTLRLENQELVTLDIDELSLREEQHLLSSSVISNQNIGLIRVHNTLGNSGLVREYCHRWRLHGR